MLWETESGGLVSAIMKMQKNFTKRQKRKTDALPHIADEEDAVSSEFKHQ